MIPVLVWKEYRQQRTVSIALTFLGALLLLGLPVVTAPGGMAAHPEAREALRMGAVMLVYIQALVCGGLLLALEGELGTLPFLDALPGYRRQLWLAKFLAGLLLVVAQIVLLMGLAAAAGLFENGGQAAWTLGAMACAGVYGFAWGILFSSFGGSATSMILLSLGGQLGAVIVVGIVAAIANAAVAVATGVAPPDPPLLFMIGLTVLTVPAAMAGSAFVFTRLDRRRLWTPPAPSPAKPPKPRRPRVAWSALFWLAWRQTRGFAAGLALLALLLGLMVLVQPVLLWPMATLLMGVLCGATAFMDEQEGPFRFLGDQRFPLGRLWLVKVGVRFAVAVAAALIVSAPSFFIALANAYSEWRPGQQYFFFERMFRSNLIGQLCPSGLFLSVWLVTGFAAGCLCGLLFRSGLAAGVLALFVGALLTAVWVPSMLGGGLHAWQALGAPVVLLLSTRLLLRPWAAGRIASWTTAVRLTPFVVLALLWVAGGLWYRVIEVPYIPENPALNAFVASLPTPEQNEGGELARRSCLRFQDMHRSQGFEQRPMRSADDVLVSSWKADDADLAAWLDKLFADEWLGMLKKSADLPTGPIQDLRQVTELSPANLLEPARKIAVVLAARGLQRQAAGDDEAYLENLRLGLHLSETMRHRGDFGLTVIVGRSVEGILVTGLDRWLEKLNGRPDLLQKALGILSRYLEATADDADYRNLAADLIVRNTAEDPIPSLQWVLSNGAGEQNSSHVREEAQWVALAWLTPWERERQDRILRVMFWGDKAQRRALYLSDQFGPLPHLGPSFYKLASPIQKCAERAMLLKLALRWYQADHGRPADKLDELVPKYLQSIPADPYDGKPFRYRLSKGEEIEWPEEPPPPGAGVPGAAPPGVNAPGMPGAAPLPATRTIPAGQGILWCIGTDGHDDGGHRQIAPLQGETVPGEDLIFLVPLPPSGK